MWKYVSKGAYILSIFFNTHILYIFLVIYGIWRLNLISLCITKEAIFLSFFLFYFLLYKRVIHFHLYTQPLLARSVQLSASFYIQQIKINVLFLFQHYLLEYSYKYCFINIMHIFCFYRNYGNEYYIKWLQESHMRWKDKGQKRLIRRSFWCCNFLKVCFKSKFIKNILE